MAYNLQWLFYINCENAALKIPESKIVDVEVGQMAQWVKAPAPKPDDLNSVPRIHMKGGREQTTISCPLSSIPKTWHTCTPHPTLNINNK